jgi:hypothetical protein
VAADYPVRSVWDAFTSFCRGNARSETGWAVFKPEPETVMAYLAEDPMWRLTGVEGKPATVYRRVAAGRTLFAFERRFGSGSRTKSCQLYDFDAQERLKRGDWAEVAGPLSKIDEREYTQSFDFDGTDDRYGPWGRITLQQTGYYPIPDTVGFVGLELTTISKERL